MPIYPRAVLRNIPPGRNDPPIKARIGILHVDAGNAHSLFHWFNGPSGGIESHFHVPKVGKPEQYRDTGWEADANHLANPFAISVETQGFGAGEWNEHQLAEIKKIMLWCRDTHDIPLRQVTSWNDFRGGWGFHIQFPQWYPKAKSCPGPDRIKQFNEILVPWMEQQGDDMFSDEDSARLERLEKKVDRLIERSKREVERDRKIRDRLIREFGIQTADIERIFKEE